MILTLDTSGRYCVVAAVDQRRTLFAATGRSERAHAEELAPLVAKALGSGDLTHIVVGRGPGSFTGLRVGLATAQVLGWARHVPVIGVCSLDVVAQQHGLRDGIVVMDARRAELFHAEYEDGIRVAGPAVGTREAVSVAVSGRVAVGDTVLLTATDRRARGDTQVDPHALAHVAASVVAAGSEEPPEPLYLRHPDVTVGRPK